MMEGWDIENFKKLKILLVLFLLYLTENIIFLNLIIVFGFQRYTLYGMRYTLYDFVIILFSTNRRQSDIVTVAIFLQLILFCHF